LGVTVAGGAFQRVTALICAVIAAGCAGRQKDQPITSARVGKRQLAQAPADDAPAGEPPPPAEVPLSYEMILGTSANGQPIKAYLFGDFARGYAPKVGTLVIAAIHGDEPPAAFVGRKLLEFLRAHPEATRGNGVRAVGVIPVANPDGVAVRTRTNARGVDCNRNFPATNWQPTRPGRNYTGPSPASEPETRAIMRAVETLAPARVVSIHSPLRCNNYDGPPAALALARLMSLHNGYPVEASVGYATPGSFGTWAGLDRGIPVVTLELPPHTPGERAWVENRDALLAVIQASLTPPEGAPATAARGFASQPLPTLPTPRSR
jgi:protein MpaA